MLDGWIPTCLIVRRFCNINCCSYFVMPHFSHSLLTHSFLANACSTFRDVRDVIPSRSFLNGHHVASIASTWFLGIPFMPTTINTSLVLAKFAQYSHLMPQRGVSCTVLTNFGFNASKVFSATIHFSLHFFKYTP